MIPRRLVAAIRWDYEHGLMSCADIARKYRMVASRDTVYRICNGRAHPKVPATKHAMAWCKSSWVKK